MRESIAALLPIAYSLFLAAAVCIVSIGSGYATTAASAYSSGPVKPAIQYDENDIAPPPAGPEDIKDDSPSPDSLISDPAPPIDETDRYIIEPEDEEPQPGRHYPDATDPGYHNERKEILADNTGPLVDETDPLVEQEDPLVDHPYPLVSQPEALVDQPSPLVDQPSPLVSHPQPLVNRSAPLVKQPNPLVMEPPALVLHPAPLVNMPPALVTQPSPLVNRSAHITH